MLASLGIYSFRPGSPLTDEVVEAAEAIGAQVALAIDNARLYQQQKQFADTMQRSLLPRARPVVEGLEVGEVYEQSSRVEVGGDLYDFLALDDGRLAVVLGDVTGHGVDATADMAMAKFVFRSLVREHAEPADFLAAANDVICSEIAGGKFISMSYVVVDGVAGTVAAASAGPSAAAARFRRRHGRPASLLTVSSSASSRGRSTRRCGRSCRTVPRSSSTPTASSRRGTTASSTATSGSTRCSRARHDLPPRALAAAVAEDAREFAGGDLSDDVAVVVVRRL